MRDRKIEKAIMMSLEQKTEGGASLPSDQVVQATGPINPALSMGAEGRGEKRGREGIAERTQPSRRAKMNGANKKQSPAARRDARAGSRDKAAALKEVSAKALKTQTPLTQELIEQYGLNIPAPEAVDRVDRIPALFNCPYRRRSLQPMHVYIANLTLYLTAHPMKSHKPI